MAHIAVHEALWRVALGEPGPSDSFSCPSPNGVIVKAACGKSARAVWAAGGGQREGSTERASPDPTPMKPGNAGGGTEPWFKATHEVAKDRRLDHGPGTSN